MTYVVTEACIGVKDQACMEVCPEFCIFAEDADVMSFIDPNRCSDCGACAEACSMGAIFSDKALPRASEEFLAINAYWFKHKTGVRQRITEIAEETGAPGVS
ncbi:MAG: indolepyruvate ferredoxin oxidoreductase subunit alpha [Alphaproteobacteria bacterium]